MADPAINIAGKAYPRTAVLAIVAIGAGVVGYAYFVRGRGEPTTETEVLVPEDLDTGILPFGGTSSGTFTEGPVAYRNDSEWYKDALDKLVYDYGVESTAIAADALDRYLAGKALTAAQIPMINFVVNSIGPPPSGAKTIRQETAAPGGTTPPPAQVTVPGTVHKLSASASKTEIRTNWFAPSVDSTHSAATRYQVAVYAGTPQGRKAVWSTTTSGRQVFTGGRFLPNHPYDVGVKAGNGAGYGPEVFVHVRTAR